MTATLPTPGAPSLPSVPRYEIQPPPGTTPALVVVQTADASHLGCLAAVLEGSAPAADILRAADYPAPAALHQALSDRLGRASIGLQLYLCGDEAFLWPLHALARDAGLQAEEIHLLRHGEARRAVYCAHCASVQLAGAADHHACQGCGVRLEVRQHFSRRLGAYLGVCADADHPYGMARV